jgi:integrase/recombinase XerC
MRQELNEYIRQGRAEGWSERTAKVYRDRLEHLGRHLSWPSAAEVVPRDLERYLESLRTAGWKRSGRRSLGSTIRSFFGWLARTGKILSNPARNLSVPRENEEELPPPPLTVEETAAILDNLPRRNVPDLRNRAFFEILYGCGLRLSEAIALDLGELDIGNRALHVRKGKGGKSRDLPLGRGAVNAARDWLALRRSLLRGPDHGALFLDRFGRRVKEFHVSGWFKVLNKARGPGARRIHPHLFRHSIAVHLLQNGADIRYVQQFLGHEKLDTTKIYLRLVPGRLKEDYEMAMPDIAVMA